MCKEQSFENALHWVELQIAQLCMKSCDKVQLLKTWQNTKNYVISLKDQLL